MDAHLIYFGIDIVAMFAVVLLGINVVISHPKSFNARIWAIIAFNSVCWLLFSRYIYSPFIPEPFQVDPGPFLVPVRFAMNLTPGLFTILAYSLFQDGERFPRWLFGVFFVQVLLEEPLPLILSIDVAQGDLLFETVPAVLQIVLIGFALFWMLASWRADLVEERRHLRVAVLVITGVYTVGTIVLGRVLVPLEVVQPFHTHVVLAAICALLCIAVILIVAQRGTQIFIEPGRRPATPAQNDVDDRFSADLEAVERAFRDDRVYREAGLAVGSLAAKLAIPEYRLRKLIHEKLGYRNFNALLHDYRIGEACDRLVSPEERHLPILTIALSVGYQSVNPFNRAFREIKGMTPSEFRARSGQPGDNSPAPLEPSYGG